MSNLGVSAGLHSIQFPKSLIMMCLKILLASLQSAIHLREVGTETEIESKKCVFLSVHRGVCVCVCVVSAWGWVFVIVHMTPTQNAREKLSETDR